MIVPAKALASAIFVQFPDQNQTVSRPVLRLDWFEIVFSIGPFHFKGDVILAQWPVSA
jgi:hypothetical protein